MIQEELPIATFAAPACVREMCLGQGQGGSDAHLDALSGHAPDPQPDMQVFHIRMANSAHRREAASVLIRKMYGWRGYAFEPSLFQEPIKITLYAETDGAVVATMSLCLDGPILLPADENFHDMLEGLRADGRRLCEPSRLAIDKGVTKRVFAALIHISYLYARVIHRYSDYVIEVNPRHVMFYQRMLGFDGFGAERPCTRVGAPAVLLRLPLERMGERIRTWGGRMEQHGEERSFYPYFFPASDEPGITGRLRAGLN
ncbi:MAG: long-chain N-acyl amino acid synthase [Massilia sp.]|nr:long-chain N-acyl amino acid synthase [Massilia sp.]